MPWQEVVTVELRQQFVHDALRRVVPVTELCTAYGISRKTGYKFLAAIRPSGLRASPISPDGPTARRPRSIRCCCSGCSRPTIAIPTGGRGSCSAW
jgi:putative transposase